MTDQNTLQKSIYKDESGIAWGLAAAFLGIVLFGAFYLIMLPVFNNLGPVAINNYISVGMVSQRTADASSYGTKTILLLPIIILLSVFAWVLVRAHERREY